MTLTIAPVGPGASGAASPAAPDSAGPSATVRGDGARVSFDPGSSGRDAAPLSQLSSAGLEAMRGFENRMDAYRAATGQMIGPAGPEAALEAARAALTPGPAEIRTAQPPSLGPAYGPSQNVGDAVEAMRMSFDYAVETQLVVKTGSQVSNATNSLLRGQ